MSDDNTTPEATATPAAPEAPKVETFSREYVEQLRQEAASHRTAKNTAVEEAKATLTREFEAKLAERDTAYTALENQLGEAWILVQKYETALDAKIPSDKVRALVELLKGTDAESIEASAKSASALFDGFSSSTPAYDPTQGSGSGELPLNGDPLLAALKRAVGA